MDIIRCLILSLVLLVCGCGKSQEPVLTINLDEALVPILKELNETKRFFFFIECTPDVKDSEEIEKALKEFRPSARWAGVRNIFDVIIRSKMSEEQVQDALLNWKKTIRVKTHQEVFHETFPAPKFQPELDVPFQQKPDVIVKNVR